MGNTNTPPDRFYKLVQRNDETPTSLFDILGTDDDERAHTRVLAWLLTPDAGHGLGTDFLSRFLEAVGVEAIVEQETVEVQPFYQNIDDVEIDIRIETKSTLIGVEIKTTHPLGESQFSRQINALRKATESEEHPSNMEYIHLTYDAANESIAVPHRLTWKEIVELIETHLAAVEDDVNIIRLREWCRCLQENVIGEFSFDPETELALRYPHWIEEFDIEVDQTKIDVDRKRIFNEYQRWFSNNYPIVDDDGADGWDGPITSEFRRGTRVIQIFKPEWNTVDTELRFEVLAKETRMRSDDNYGGDHDLYRTRDAHVELTMTYPGVSKDKRDALADRLTNTDQEKLKNAGFVRVSDELPEECDANMNKYHMYSKQVRLDFEDSQQTLEGLKRGTEALVGLENTLDDYVAMS